MKLMYSFYGILGLLTMSFTGAIFNNKGPDKLIVGRWQEVNWKYELVNDPTKAGLDLTSSQIHEITDGLNIHKAEIWEFGSDNTLNLFAKNGELIRTLTYYVKGRGNIIELKQDGLAGERYEIQYLDDGSLELFLNFDLQVKGLVKLSFNKIK